MRLTSITQIHEISMATQTIPPNLSHLLGVRDVVGGLIDPSLAAEFTELEKKIRSSQFYLVVIGMFKRGKSSLINRLLERDLAPVGVIPLTAIITRFEHGPEDAAEIIFESGAVKKVPVSDITQYVAEEMNPRNEKQVQYVKVLSPSPLLQSVHLVDTPGLGSEFQHNNRTTLSFIPKIDAGLFILSADTPVSQADLQLLANIRATVPKIVFVLNKADLVSEKDLHTLTDYNRHALASFLRLENKNDVEIYTASSLPEAGKGDFQLPALRHRLQDLVTRDREGILGKSHRKRLEMLINQSMVQLRLRLDALTMPLKTLTEKKSELDRSFDIMQVQKSEFESILKGQIKTIQDEAARTINQLADHLRANLREAFHEDWEKTYEKASAKGFEGYQTTFTESLINRFNEAKAIVEKDVRGRFSNLLSEYGNRSQTFLTELSKHMESILGIDFGLITDLFDLDVYTSFYFDYGKGESVSYVFPSFFNRLTHGTWDRRHFMKRLHQHYKELVTVNSAAVIYDLEYKIQESFRKFNYDLNSYLTQILESIRHILEEIIEARHQAHEQSDAGVTLLKGKLAWLEQAQKAAAG